MRISDWSSDVCSSDLHGAPRPAREAGGRGADSSGRRAAGAPAPRRGAEQWGIEQAGGRRGHGAVLLLAVFVGGPPSDEDRKSVVTGKRVSVRVDLGGRRHLKKKKERKHRITPQ